MLDLAPSSPRVLVVGAGPVGLYMALSLVARGIETLVIERRPGRSRATRAIGVHPPGIAALDAVGVGDAVRAHGVRVGRALAFGADGALAALDLTRAGEVLAVPQPRTEAAIEERLGRLAAGALLRAHELIDFVQDRDGVDVVVRAPGGTRSWRVELLVGCDGRASRVRELLGIGGRGGPYPDRYVMADVPDPGGPRDEAAIHLHRDGVVESFPLAGARRWVAHVGAGAPHGRGAAALLSRALEARLGVSLAPRADALAASFGIERFLADRFVLGRVALAGDAAHVVSPIGGQGMNLGWLDAAALSAAFERGSVRGGVRLTSELEAYASRRRALARLAIRRAACNTLLGRPMPGLVARARDAVLRGALAPPFDDHLLGAFTMRGLA